MSLRPSHLSSMASYCTTADSFYTQRPGGITELSTNDLRPTYHPVERKGMFSEIKNDVSKFVSEYRYIFYFIALALLLDHLIFRGVFRERLQKMTERLIDKVEAKVGG